MIRKCIICKVEFRIKNERQITCGDFDCKAERRRSIARHNMELKRKNKKST